MAFLAPWFYVATKLYLYTFLGVVLMIGFDVSAVRSIIFTVAVYIGIGTPPILIEQTKQLVFQCGFPSSDVFTFRQGAGFCSNQQLVSSSSDFSLSLEWTLFNPNGGFCPAKNPPPLVVVNSLVELDFEPSSFDEDHFSSQHVANHLPDYTEICPLEIIFALPVCYNTSFVSNQPEPSVIELSLTSEFVSISPIHQDSKFPLEISSLEFYRFDETNHSTSLSTDSPGSDSGVLCYHEQLRAYLRNAILSSLPETWAKWITSNRPTLGIICVTVMCVSLLWPLLFVVWKQVNAKRRMIGELNFANGACRVMNSRLLALIKEKADLKDLLAGANTNSKKLEELFDSCSLQLLQINQDKALVEDLVSRQLSQIKRLEGETQYYSERMAKLDSECSHFLVRVADLTEEKQSLETENLLVKYAKEAAVTSLATLQTDHEQAKITHQQQIEEFNRELEKKTSLLEEYADENGNLKELVALLEVESKKNSDQLRETKQKIERTTSECFCSKEDNLLTKLVASEKKLEQSELLEFEANEKLIIAEERNVSHQLLESKLAASQKKLQRYELLEFEAQEKLINTEERLEEEQTKSKESQQLLRQIIRSMYFQAELCKDQARDSWRYQQEIQLARREITELTKRLNTESELREATIRRQTHLSKANSSCRLLSRRLPATPPGPLFKTPLDVSSQKTAAPEVKEASQSLLITPELLD